jgi:hypothetical protein
MVRVSSSLSFRRGSKVRDVCSAVVTRSATACGVRLRYVRCTCSISRRTNASTVQTKLAGAGDGVAGDVSDGARPTAARRPDTRDTGCTTRVTGTGVTVGVDVIAAGPAEVAAVLVVGDWLVTVAEFVVVDGEWTAALDTELSTVDRAVGADACIPDQRRGWAA